MTNYSPLPASGLVASWTNRLDGTACTVALRWENEAWTADGHIESNNVQFVMRISASWMVQQFMLFRDLDEPDLWLATDGHGRWGEVNGAHRTELDGCVDIALDDTPFAHIVPIRRLPLHVGHGAQQNVIHINTDTLGVTVRPHTYERINESTWRYDHGGEATTATVDDYGFIVDDGRFTRNDHSTID
jgi:hypothetical protein